MHVDMDFDSKSWAIWHADSESDRNDKSCLEHSFRFSIVLISLYLASPLHGLRNIKRKTREQCVTSVFALRSEGKKFVNSSGYSIPRDFLPFSFIVFLFLVFPLLLLLLLLLAHPLRLRLQLSLQLLPIGADDRTPDPTAGSALEVLQRHDACLQTGELVGRRIAYCSRARRWSSVRTED